MPLKQLNGSLRRKRGTQYWVVQCPYCGKRHWLAAGAYTEDPNLYKADRKLPCGSRIEVLNRGSKHGRN